MSLIHFLNAVSTNSVSPTVRVFHELRKKYCSKARLAVLMLAKRHPFHCVLWGKSTDDSFQLAVKRLPVDQKVRESQSLLDRSGELFFIEAEDLRGLSQAELRQLHGEILFFSDELDFFSTAYEEWKDDAVLEEGNPKEEEPVLSQSNKNQIF